MRLPQAGGAIEYIAVDPDALQEALIRNGAQECSDDIAKTRLDHARGRPNAATIAMLREKK